MNSILVTPKNKKEFKLLSELLVKMNVPVKTLSSKEKEEFGMIKKVSRETVMEKLRNW